MRILSLSPSSTEILFALGAAQEVIGVTHACDYPAEAVHKPQYGTWLQTHPERLAEAKPDLIVTTTFFPPELERLRIHHQLLHLRPTGLAGVFESIQQLGETIGRAEDARNLVHRMQKDFEMLRASAPSNRLLVYCEEWPDPPMVSGNWVPEILELVGARPFGGVHNKPSQNVNVDALHAADPDLMVFPWCQPAMHNDLHTVKQRPGWGHFRAVQTDAMVRIPPSLLQRPGPRLLEGAALLQQALHAFQHLR